MELKEIETIKYLTSSDILRKYWGQVFLGFCQASRPSGHEGPGPRPRLPRPRARLPQSVFPLAGGKGPASCSLCPILLVGQLCLAPAPIPADRQLVPLTRAGHQAHTRCRTWSEGTKPLCTLTLRLSSAWLTSRFTAGAAAWGASSLCALLTWGLNRQASVFPKPKLLAKYCLPIGERVGEGEPWACLPPSVGRVVCKTGF